MAKVDMNAWYTANKDALEGLKRDFVDSVTEDEGLFRNYQSQAIYGSRLSSNSALTINLDPIDAIVSQLGRAQFVLPNRLPEMDASNIERYKTHVFSDSRLDGFEDKLKSVYSNFTTPAAYGSGNTQIAIQEAFYFYQYDRDKELLIHRIDEAANQWAADGFMRGPGAFSYDSAQMINDFDRDRTAKTENVFGDLARIVQSNIQASIQGGIQIEDLHMDFAIKHSELSKVFIQSAVDAYVAEIEKRIEEQRAQISKIKYLTQSMGLDHKADAKKNQLELQVRNAKLAAYTSATNSYINEQSAAIVEQLRLAANIAEGYGSIFSSYGSMFTGVSYEE